MPYCVNCNKEIYKFRKGQKFCSLSCSAQFNHSHKDQNFLIRADLDKDFVPYIIGLFLGDGNLSKYKKETFRMSLQLKDKDMIEQIHQIISPNRKIYVQKARKETHSDGYSVLTMNKEVIGFFRKYGMVEKKSKILAYPKQFNEVSSCGLNHFIRGYFDANGSVFNNTVSGHLYKHLSITTGSEEFANGLKRILAEVGFSPTIVKDKRHEAFYVKMYRVQEMQDLEKFLYKDAAWYLPRKRNMFEMI